MPAPAQSICVVALAMAMILAATRPARAEIRGAESIDWMVADSDLVARCKVAELSDVEPLNPHSWKRVVFEVGEVFKGQLTRQVTVLTPEGFPQVASAWKASGEERIIFFQRSDRPTSLRYGTGAEILKKSPLMLCNAWTLQSSRLQWNQPPVAYTLDFRVLYKPEEIDAAIRAAAACKPRPVGPSIVPRGNWGFWGSGTRSDTPGAIWLEAPFESEVSRALFAGSGVVLIVPLDSRLEPMAFNWMANPNMRGQAIGVLAYFKSERSIEFFKSLLNDNHFSQWGYGGPETIWRFDRRQAAYDTLRAWQIDVQRPAINMPDDGYLAISIIRCILVAIAVAAGLIAIIFIAYWLRFRIGRAVAMPGLIATGRQTAFVIGLLLAAAVIAIEIQSTRIAREATGMLGTTRWWISTHDGTLTLAGACDWPVMPFSIASFDINAVPTDRWADYHSGITTVHGWKRLNIASGMLPGQTSARVYGGPVVSSPYGRINLPLWMIVAALLLWPAVSLVGFLRSRVTRRRRLRNGLCGSCGYDLRGGQNRCPECGAVSVIDAGRKIPAISSPLLPHSSRSPS